MSKVLSSLSLDYRYNSGSTNSSNNTHTQTWVHQRHNRGTIWGMGTGERDAEGARRWVCKPTHLETSPSQRTSLLSSLNYRLKHFSPSQAILLRLHTYVHNIYSRTLVTGWFRKKAWGPFRCPCISSYRFTPSLPNLRASEDDCDIINNREERKIYPHLQSYWSSAPCYMYWSDWLQSFSFRYKSTSDIYLLLLALTCRISAACVDQRALDRPAWFS